MFMDVATPQLWTESVFGLTSGWWHLTDRDLRPEQPLLQRAQWESALKQSGFAETTSLPGLHGPDGGEGQIGVLARKAAADTAAADEAQALEAPVEQSWIIFADESESRPGTGRSTDAPRFDVAASCAAARNSPPRTPTPSPFARTSRRIGSSFSRP